MRQGNMYGRVKRKGGFNSHTRVKKGHLQKEE